VRRRLPRALATTGDPIRSELRPLSTPAGTSLRFDSVSDRSTEVAQVQALAKQPAAYDGAVPSDSIPSPGDLRVISVALGTSVAFVERLGGGISATTDVLETSDGARVVLRHHGSWSIGFDDGLADREWKLLTAAGAAGVPTPPVLWAGRLGDRSAIITGFVDGHTALLPTSLPGWANSLAATLASIHGIEVGSDLAELLQDAPTSPISILPPVGPASHPDYELLIRARTELAPESGGAGPLIHGDYWPGNLLCRHGEIVAVLDWEAATIGSPAADVAYCATEMRFLGFPDEATKFINAYRELTGSSLKALDYWLITALCRGISDPGSFVDAWRGLGHIESQEAVIGRQQQLVDEFLGR